MYIYIVTTRPVLELDTLTSSSCVQTPPLPAACPVLLNHQPHLFGLFGSHMASQTTQAVLTHHVLSVVSATLRIVVCKLNSFTQNKTIYAKPGSCCSFS